ncbi:MAG: N-acetylmuramoyl-L-alanine amidase [Victivallaceae bacterium]|nr:N-acetylmuramoyl-L-alanine amidase [Victivallaceae bacterium]
MKPILSRFALLLAATLFASSVQSAPAGTTMVSGKKYCDFNALSAMLGLRRTPVEGGFAYYRGNETVLSLIDKHISARLCGMDVALSYPVSTRNGVPFISVIDWKSTFQAMFLPRCARRQRVATVLLDPGHGGRDCGAVGRVSVEKKLTLRIASRVAALLRARGFRVVMTRTSDREIPLAQRSALAGQVGADIFVSIHLNSASPGVSGIETYCLTPAGAPSSNDRAKKQGNMSSCPGNRWDANNFLLAAAVHRKLLVRTGAADRGLKRARFAVLRDLTVPGILIEAGFLSHVQEERRLVTGNYVESLARAIADGIAEYGKGIGQISAAPNRASTVPGRKADRPR